MSEDELEVLYTECSYGDADTYEYDFADVPSMKNKDGLWINVNASEKEIKEAKEFYEDQ